MKAQNAKLAQDLLACQQELQKLHRDLQDATWHLKDRAAHIQQLEDQLKAKQKQYDDLKAQLVVASKQLDELQQKHQADMDAWGLETAKVLRETTERSKAIANLKKEMTSMILDLKTKLCSAQLEVKPYQHFLIAAEQPPCYSCALELG